MLFKKKKVEVELPTTPLEYPLGSFVSTEKGVFFIKTESRRLRLITPRVVESWAPQRIARSSEVGLSNYKVFGKLKFRNGSLIKSITSGKIYLIESGLKRKVISPDSLTRIGARPQDAVYVSDEELNLHLDGDDLNYSN